MIYKNYKRSMCEKTKPQSEDDKKESELTEIYEKIGSENGDYYYDDAHGYEIYNPEQEEETDEN